MTKALGQRKWHSPCGESWKGFVPPVDSLREVRAEPGWGGEGPVLPQARKLPLLHLWTVADLWKKERKKENKEMYRMKNRSFFSTANQRSGVCKTHSNVIVFSLLYECFQLNVNRHDYMHAYSWKNVNFISEYSEMSIYTVLCTFVHSATTQVCKVHLKSYAVM